MFDLVNRTLIFPAYMKWNNDDRLKHLTEYEKKQWLSSDELADSQFNAFLSILKYATTHVPYYRKRFKAAQIQPEDIKYPEDIKNIPILTKKDLQENLESLVSPVCPPSQRYKDASGGSTGQPTIFYGDISKSPSKDAAMLMTDKWTGWKVGEKSAYLWGADREVNKIRSLKEQFVQKYVYRKNLLNAFNMDENDMGKFAKQLLIEKPTLIVAYANAAYRFALFLKQNGIVGILPKGIVCSAETLTDEKRNLIQDVFQCKVLNRYGSREVGLIGSECSFQQGLHINTNGVYVELIPVSTTNVDSISEIIVTDLENQVMPIIRYNTGDTSNTVNKKCQCGRGLPLIGGITGRTSDFIVHPNGKLIHGEFFSHMFYGLKGVVQFQIIQQNIKEIEVNIVVNNSFIIDTKIYIENKICNVFENSVKTKVTIVKDIPMPPSGKYRFAISNIYNTNYNIIGKTNK